MIMCIFTVGLVNKGFRYLAKQPPPPHQGTTQDSSSLTVSFIVALIILDTYDLV